MPSLRETLNNNTPLVAVALIAVIAVAWWLALRPSGASPHGSAYYLDLQTQKLFAAPENELSPIPAPSGGEAVKALVFTCTACDDPDARFVGYLEKYSDAYKQSLREGKELLGEEAYTGELFGTPDGTTWLPKHSPEGQALVMSLGNRCNGGKVTPCLP